MKRIKRVKGGPVHPGPTVPADSEKSYLEEDTDGGAPRDEEESPSPDAMQVIAIYLKSVARESLLTQSEEAALAEKIAQGDEAARQKMIEANLRLVICLAKRYTHSGLLLSDLIEEGNIGLIKAVTRYDLKRECRFSTYAAWWIRQSIQRAIINNSKVVRLPVHMVEQMNRYLSCVEDLVQERGRAPELFEIAQQMGIKENRVRHIQQMFQQTYSLDAPLEEGNSPEITLQDVIPAEEHLSPLSAVEAADRRGTLVSWLQSLKEIERRVILLRFGFTEDEEWTLEKVANELGLTRERIRQIEAAALKSLRRHVAAGATRLAEIL